MSKSVPQNVANGQLMAAETRHDRHSGMLSFSMAAGLMFGACLMVLVRYATPYLPDTLTNDTSQRAGARLLVEAHNDTITYRASAIGIARGSALEQSIMAEQDENVELLNRIDPDGLNAPVLFDVRYHCTAHVGPLASVLKVENVTRKSGDKETRYSASMINDFRREGFELKDIFIDDMNGRLKLDVMMCEALHQLRKRRVGPNSEFYCSVKHQFLTAQPVVFVPSDRANAIGGLRFYFEAGRIGSAEEGPYIVTIPQSRFRDDVIPAYRGLFDGQPVEFS